MTKSAVSQNISGNSSLFPEAQRIIDARHHDPFEYLGKHPSQQGIVVRAFKPGAAHITIADGNHRMQRVANTDLFEWYGTDEPLPDHYQLQWTDRWGNQHTSYDPYSFPPRLADFDIHLFNEGRHQHAYRILG